MMRRLAPLALATVAVIVVPVQTAAQATGHEKDPPRVDSRVRVVAHDTSAFGPDPMYVDTAYDFQAQLDIYGAKYLNRTQRPLIEWGRELYAAGPFRPAPTPLGRHNILIPQLLVYGDLRTGAGYNTVGEGSGGTWANRLNLEVDLKLTATERVHALFQPFEKDGVLTRFNFAGEDGASDGFQSNFSPLPSALFFEGDLGAMVGGLIGRDAPFDMPIAAGLMPLLFQNGIWIEDAFTGAALTLPARNSGALDWSNYDITFFAGLDRVSGLSPDDDARIFGVTTFIEAYSGYIESGYAFVAGEEAAGQDFHSIALAFTRRYGHRLSNSIRYIGAIGQGTAEVEPAANGHLLLIENSLITRRPTTVVPYLNLFFGLDRPASAARDRLAGGILKNTGLNFEADALTGFPALNATGHDAVGGALGLNLLGSSLNRQLVLEAAFAYPHTTTVAMPGEQYAFGVRAQQVLTNAIILRADAVYGQRKDVGSISGARIELRHKF